MRHPPSADSLRIGTTVALLAHAGLIAALAFGVAWKREEIATVSAELWSAVPQQAAPAPRAEAVPTPPPPPLEPVVKPAPPAPAPPPVPKVLEPPPAPREAEIARERADKRRREAEEADKLAEKQAEKQARLDKAAKEKAEKKEATRKEAELREAETKAAEKAAAAEKAKEAAQQEKAAKSREDNLKRLQKQLGEGSDTPAPAPAPGATPGAGTAAQSSGPSAGYAGRLRAYLKPKLVYTGRNIGSSPAVVRVRVAPDGSILARELIKSSGQADWDQAVLDAIDRAGMLPRDTDSRIPPVIDIPWTASER